MKPGYQEQILYILNKHHSIVTVELGDAVTDDILKLIDSAKREGKKEALEKLVSLLHIYMDDKTPPGGEWPKQDMVVVVSFIESLVAQLEQSKESE